LEQLEKYTNNIYVIDNKSVYPPLVEFLNDLEKKQKEREQRGDKMGIKVLRMPENYGHKVYEREEIIALGGEKYIVTDPDLRFNPNMPVDCIDILARLSDKYKANKIGLALNLTDPNINVDKYYKGKTIVQHEQAYWNDRIKEENEYELYRADIDTTFALINKQYYSIGSMSGIRVAGNFTAIHKTWMIDWEKELQPGEYEAYLNEENKSTTYTMWNAKPPNQ